MKAARAALAVALFATWPSVARGQDQSCIEREEHTCRPEVRTCPRAVDLAPRDRSCLRCGVSWVTGDLLPAELRRLVKAVRRRDPNPIASIEVSVPNGKSVAKVSTISACPREGIGAGAGAEICLTKTGVTWRVTHRGTYVD